MSRAKKKKPHYCKNHPHVVARGKCAKCGAWICTDCAYLKHGQFFCTYTCRPKRSHKTPAPAIADKHAELVSVTPRNAGAPGPAPARPPIRGNLVLWAAIVFLVLLSAFGFMFGLRQTRDNRRLRQQNVSLEHDRIRAIDLLRGQKHKIDELRAQLQMLQDDLEEKNGKKRKHGSSPPAILRSYVPTPTVTNPETGLPLGFNNGAVDKKLVALTFDGGSYANAAGDILDTLKSRNVAATMFLTGGFMERFPDLVGRIAGQGHEVGNHSYSHPHLTTWVEEKTHRTRPGVTEAVLARELERCGETFANLTGAVMSPIWRAPYGEINNQLCRWSQAHGYFHIGWRQGRRWWENLDSNDWVPDEDTPGYHSPEEVYEKVTRLARTGPYGINGGIILLHLGTVRKEPDHQVHRILGKLIDDLRGLGYEFVTVTVLLRESGIDVSVLTRKVAGEL